MNQTRPLTPIPVSLSPDTIDLLVRLSKEQGISRSQLIRQAIEEYLARQKGTK